MKKEESREGVQRKIWNALQHIQHHRWNVFVIILSTARAKGRPRCPRRSGLGFGTASSHRSYRAHVHEVDHHVHGRRLDHDHAMGARNGRRSQYIASVAYPCVTWYHHSWFADGKG